MASKWNGAGTWEERDKSEFARDHLKGLLQAINCQGVATTSVHTCKGEARKLHVRGKDRAGFELAIKVLLEGTCDSTAIKATLEAHDVSETDVDDVELDMTFTPPTFASKTSLQKDLQTAVNQAFQALKAAILAA
eukprot:m.135304 g.135304  ORF g.135304 m.135304 type:complete len:135 (-) comp15988_c0_seq2:2613-3017(-)